MDPCFGDRRLLCLSARKEVVCEDNSRQTIYGRPFLPYCVDSSKVLTDLLKLLDEKRSKKARTKNCAIYVDEQNKEVQINDFTM